MDPLLWLGKEYVTGRSGGKWHRLPNGRWRSVGVKNESQEALGTGLQLLPVA